MPPDSTLIDKYGRVLLDQSQPMKKRFRALFALKHFGGRNSIDHIAACFSDPSALLKHELAYCLGQMRDPVAVPCLQRVLQDLQQDPMVRHEAAEALGAIGDQSSLPLLQQYAKDPAPAVAETCQIALKRLEWLTSRDPMYSEAEKNSFSTIDPAPPITDVQNVSDLKQILLNPSNSLWQRYRAMFKLRNIASEESIFALAEGLKCEDSALFRHEIAFVLGQLQSPLAVRQLIDRLRKTDENPMVRHECAETLGSIGSEACKKVLQEFLHDPEPVVRESCEVALDICDYNNECNEFQYAACSDIPNSQGQSPGADNYADAYGGTAFSGTQ